MAYVYKVKVNNELNEKLRKLHYEVDVKEEVLSKLFQNDDPNLMEKASYKSFMESLIDAKGKYDSTKMELQSMIVPEELANNHQVEWNLDFATAIAIVTVSCDCGIELCKTLELPTEV